MIVVIPGHLPQTLLPDEVRLFANITAGHRELSFISLVFIFARCVGGSTGNLGFRLVYQYPGAAGSRVLLHAAHRQWHVGGT
jgi:hypothetical protein